ncbi:cyanoexosortase B system-associated protein [Cronbergia sp. UHCC 0137]|uniref:cyanoexosortase B system-associated protein n=1 Tax=Cronbergia sp. UHCC 0137 TaxID=3110239 RepID=UPI002B21655B|nr:cyanoexosortase B system-associated protein [Cronbergia sp. UHCC 0137]MEA5618097.1 cyanoexosortase B system-associated protein [Cronbergia sp. UHCC 0137]
MISSLAFLKKHQWRQIAVLGLLLLILGIGAIPGYLTGKWQWKQPPSLTNLQSLKHLRDVGLDIPGWKTIEQSVQPIGEHKWSLQLIQKQDSSSQAILLLLPQNGLRDQPEVEWTEINSWGRINRGKWNLAQYRSANFTVKKPEKLNTTGEIKIEARFFRVTTPQETFAVLQWYAMPDGGNQSPFKWFVADQLAQWQKRRVPWVAVSILLQIEPLGQVEQFWAETQSLGATVQTALMAGVL